MIMQRTPLFAAHQRLGAKLIEFGGWEMPLHYSSIRDEHLAVRRAGGLFDISHMGEVSVRGPGALGFLNHTLTDRKSTRLNSSHGSISYAAFCLKKKSQIRIDATVDGSVPGCRRTRCCAWGQ